MTALQDNDGARVTRATRGVGALVPTNSQCSGRYWLNAPSTILPAGNAASALAVGSGAGCAGGNLIHPWRANSVKIASAERTLNRPFAVRHCQCAHKARAKPERPAWDCSTTNRRAACTSSAAIVRPRITCSSIISGPAPFNYTNQANRSPRRAQVANVAVVLRSTVDIKSCFLWPNPEGVFLPCRMERPTYSNADAKSDGVIAIE
jgi:hypothetical protein